jgi:hypothetical protein
MVWEKRPGLGPRQHINKRSERTEQRPFVRPGDCFRELVYACLIASSSIMHVCGVTADGSSVESQFNTQSLSSSYGEWKNTKTQVTGRIANTEERVQMMW